MAQPGHPFAHSSRPLNTHEKGLHRKDFWGGTKSWGEHGQSYISIITIIGSQISRSGATESMAISSKLYVKCTCTNNLLQSHWVRSSSKSRFMPWILDVFELYTKHDFMSRFYDMNDGNSTVVVNTCCKHVITLHWCYIAMMELYILTWIFIALFLKVCMIRFFIVRFFFNFFFPKHFVLQCACINFNAKDTLIYVLFSSNHIFGSNLV